MELNEQAGTETVTVSLPAAVAEQLRREADRRGEPLDAYLGRLAGKEAAADSPRAARTDEEAAAWIADWEAWAASRPARAVNLDDSRESIYEGCGE